METSLHEVKKTAVFLVLPLYLGSQNKVAHYHCTTHCTKTLCPALEIGAGNRHPNEANTVTVH
jgi:hypothetical protein